MAVNKNFVVKNGLEVNTNLLLADADNSRVGVGTSVPSFTLHVFGGIGVTDVSVTGVTTLSSDLKVGSGGTGFVVTTDSATGAGQSVGIRTDSPAYTLDVRGPVSTGTTALYVQGDARITGDLFVDDITFDDATMQDLTVTDTLTVAGVAHNSCKIVVISLPLVVNFMLQVTSVHLVLLLQHHLLVLVKLVSHLKAPLLERVLPHWW